MIRTPAMPSAWLVLLLGLRLALGLGAAAPIPPAPDRHVVDHAGILSPAARSAIDARLAQFERETSSQIVVWTERKLPPDAALEEYVIAVFRGWKIGLARTNNGVLLAVFVDDRRMRIEVGRGLEGALPDALTGRIIRDEIQPRFRANDYDGGINAAVTGIIAATKGEYRGTGRTATDRNARPFGTFGPILAFIIVIVLIRIFASRARGRNRSWGGWGYSSGGLSSGGWGGGGGGGGGGGSGGFSGGGGDSGGGGASGSW